MATPTPSQLAGDIERLVDRVHAGAVGCVHRVQRLDGERHTRRTGMRQHGRDAVGDHLARARQVAGRARQAADDEDEAICAEFGGLVDGAEVVVDIGLAAGRGISREHAAAA